MVNLLRQERRRSFQQLANEADLLAKHGQPIDGKNQLRVSLGKKPVERPRRAGQRAHRRRRPA